MKRPMVFAVVFFIAGILAGQYFSIPFGIALFFSCAIFWFISLKEKWEMKFFLIFLLFFALGFSRFQWKYNDTEVFIENLSPEENDTIVEGSVREKGIPKEGGVTLTVKSKVVTIPSGKSTVKPIIFKVWIEGKTKFSIGDKVVIRGQVTKFSDKPSAIGFIESKYYHIKGYDYKLTAKSIQKAGAEKGLFLLRYKMQNALEQVYDTVLPSVESGILKAMVMGDKSDLSEDIQNLYNKGGIAHILAVSGLHASFVVLAVFFLFQKGLRWNKRICSGITMLVAIGYLLFVLVLLLYPFWETVFFGKKIRLRFWMWDKVIARLS